MRKGMTLDFVLTIFVLIAIVLAILFFFNIFKL